MRDVNRIDPYLAEVAKVWKKYPDLRFIQLIQNCFFTPDGYFIEDDKSIEVLKEFYRDRGEQ